MIARPPDYYEQFPPSLHQPGDIWHGLPTHGVLPRLTSPALVITPACDLANRKVESITYVPIVGIREFLGSRSFLPELIRATEGQLNTAGQPLPLASSSVGVPIRPTDIEAAQAIVAADLLGASVGSKELAARDRAEAGLRALRMVLGGSSPVASIADVEKLLGKKEFEQVVGRLVTNAHRPDVHFLPADGGTAQWSGVPVHSVALFRYPLSIPIDLLDLAATTTDEGWSTALRSYSGMYPCVASLHSVRPMKYSRVRDRFLPDLLTRFVGLYGRLGSPDFSAQTVAEIIVEVAGG